MSQDEVRNLRRDFERLKSEFNRIPRPHKTQGEQLQQRELSLTNTDFSGFNNREPMILKDADSGSYYFGVVVNGELKKIQLD